MIDPVEISPPDWLPTAVLEVANFLAEMAPDMPADIEAVLRRLLVDERMKGVWQDLDKKKRESTPTSERFYEAAPPAAVQSWAAMAKALHARAAEYRALGDETMATRYEQHAAAVEGREGDSSTAPLNEDDERGIVFATVFALAFRLYASGQSVVSRRDLERRSSDLRAKGQASIADALELQAKSPENAKFVVSRTRSDPRINAFVEGVAKEMRAMFGQDMPGVIATITNVAFDRSDYDRDRIRALLKDRS